MDRKWKTKREDGRKTTRTKLNQNLECCEETTTEGKRCDVPVKSRNSTFKGET